MAVSSVGRFYGKNSTCALIKSRHEDIERVFIRDGDQGVFKEELRFLAQKKIQYRLVPSVELTQIAQSEHHQGICATAKVKQIQPLSALIKGFNSSNHSVMMILDGVGNPHNIGGILRSCQFFGVQHVVLVQKEGVKLHAALARTSEGAIEFCSVSHVRESTEVVELLESNSIGIIASVAEQENIAESKKANGHNPRVTYKKVALVVGSEDKGVSSDFIDASYNLISIPPNGEGMQSLNVSVATGILLYGLSET